MYMTLNDIQFYKERARLTTNRFIVENPLVLFRTYYGKDYFINPVTHNSYFTINN